jgi:hypothetical protein
MCEFFYTLLHEILGYSNGCGVTLPAAFVSTRDKILVLFVSNECGNWLSKTVQAVNPEDYIRLSASSIAPNS